MELRRYTFATHTAPSVSLFFSLLSLSLPLSLSIEDSLSLSLSLSLYRHSLDDLEDPERRRNIGPFFSLDFLPTLLSTLLLLSNSLAQFFPFLSLLTATKAIMRDNIEKVFEVILTFVLPHFASSRLTAFAAGRQD